MTQLARAWRLSEWRRASFTGDGRLEFLGEAKDLARVSLWGAHDVPLLWLYNLHYFDDMTAAGAASRRAIQRHLVHRWVAEQAPGKGPAWDAYPTSLRLVNWIKTAWAEDPEGRAIVNEDVVTSMASQADWLSRHVEHHLQANHLWANAKALTFAGAFFDGTHAGEWLRQGAVLLARELHEQILADGGHYERSPMYHAIVLEDVLDLIQLADVVPDAFEENLVERLRQSAPLMLRWLRLMSHPDGDISFFNDAAFDIAPRVEVLESYARSLNVPVPSGQPAAVEWLRDSGYVRLTQGPAVAICDVAPIEPAYQPGHAHADTLSFELSVHGRRVIVNSGTSTYERDALRAWQRSTAAHNAVVVDGQNSSDVWAAFRVGKRARVRSVDAGVNVDGSWATGTHDGYATWRKPTLHERRWTLSPEALTIEDSVSDKARPAEAFLYLAPDVEPGRDVHLAFDRDIAGSREPAEWFPRFGQALPNTRIRTPLRNGTLTTTIRWAGTV